MKKPLPYRAFTVALVALGVCGCNSSKSSPPSQADSHGESTNGQSISISLRLTFAGTRVQAVVPVLDRSSVQHVRIAAFELKDGNEIPLKDHNGLSTSVRVDRDQLDELIYLNNLRWSSVYRIRGYAYSSDQESDASLVSHADSFIDLGAIIANTTVLPQLTIRLKSTLFMGHSDPVNPIFESGKLVSFGEVGVSVSSPAPLSTPPVEQVIGPLPADGSAVEWKWDAQDWPSED